MYHEQMSDIMLYVGDISLDYIDIVPDLEELRAHLGQLTDIEQVNCSNEHVITIEIRKREAKYMTLLRVHYQNLKIGRFEDLGFLFQMFCIIFFLKTQSIRDGAKLVKYLSWLRRSAPSRRLPGR